MTRKPIIGLVGGIGSGKTTVAALLAEAGAAVISSDELSRAELCAPDVVETVKSWWGPSVCDSSGALDRRRLAATIFADATQRRRLERLLHPRIARQREGLIEAYQQDARCRAIVLDTPLLIESKLDRRCDAVVFVEAADGVRKERVARVRGWSEAQWARREKSQNALDKKRSRADYVVANNSSDLDELRSAVQDLLARLRIPGGSGS